MSVSDQIKPEAANEIWREYLTTGTLPDMFRMPWYKSRRLHALYRLLPDNPRCRICYYPFQGIGGVITRRVLGVLPSRLNPQVCNDCDEFIKATQGGAELELSLLFADVRGSTQLAEAMSPAEFSRLINRFYNATTRVLFNSNAMVEKLIGDAVTGFFTPGFAGSNHARVAVDAAREILRATGHFSPAGPWIQVGVGVHTGPAYVGAVHSDSGVSDIAVLGDAANIAARLAGQAAQGEIHLSQATAQAAGLDPAGAKILHQALRGRSEPVDVWVLSS